MLNCYRQYAQQQSHSTPTEPTSSTSPLPSSLISSAGPILMASHQNTQLDPCSTPILPVPTPSREDKAVDEAVSQITRGFELISEKSFNLSMLSLELPDLGFRGRPFRECVISVNSYVDNLGSKCAILQAVLRISAEYIHHMHRRQLIPFSPVQLSNGGDPRKDQALNKRLRRLKGCAVITSIIIADRLLE